MRPLLLALLALLTLLGGAAPAAARPVPALDPPELRALWVDAFHDGIKTPRQVDDLLAWAREANFNALFVQVRRRGDAYYNRSVDPRSEDPDLQPGFDALQYLIERAHQGPRPLQVHAWLTTFALWNKRDQPPADPAHVFNAYGPTAGDATWLMQRDDGATWAGDDVSGSYYLDPGNPDAARYTVDSYLNVIRNYDVDGVHIDQARYAESVGQDGRWGYNPTSVARFNARFERQPGSRPDPRDPAWMAWRREQVTAVVRRLYLEAKALKPWVVVSGAVVAWGSGPRGADGWERSAPYGGVFQDWRSWLQEGIVDYVLPMNYYRETEPQSAWFDAWSAWQQANRGKRGVVIGMGSYLNDAEGALAQLQRARALGPLGVALYSYAVPVRGSEADPGAGRAALADRLRAVFPRPAPVPDLPWRSRPTEGGLLVEIPGLEAVAVSVRGPGVRDWLTDGTGFAGGVDLPPGRYEVGVSAPGVDPRPVEVIVQPGRATTLRFARGARID